MKRSIIITGAVLLLIIILIFLGKYLVKKFLSPAPTSNQTSTTYKKEDINKDGTVDSVDEEILKKQSGCQNKQPCWNKVIGKTLSGDNPIYASDLDLNGDGIIDLLDIQRMKIFLRFFTKAFRLKYRPKQRKKYSDRSTPKRFSMRKPVK